MDTKLATGYLALAVRLGSYTLAGCAQVERSGKTFVFTFFLDSSIGKFTLSCIELIRTSGAHWRGETADGEGDIGVGDACTLVGPKITSELVSSSSPSGRP